MPAQPFNFQQFWDDYGGLILGGGLAAAGVPIGPALAAGGVVQETNNINNANANNDDRWKQALGLYGYNPDGSGNIKGKGGGNSTILPQGSQGIGGPLQDSIAADRAMGERELNSLALQNQRAMYGLTGAAQDAYTGLGNAYGAMGSRNDAVGGQLASDLKSGYGDITGGFGQRESDVMGLLGGYGRTRLNDINEQFDDLGRSSAANLTGSGLGASTVLSSNRQGIERNRARERDAAQEAISTQLAGTLAGLRGDTLAARERGLLGTTGLAERNLDRSTNIGLAGAGARERGIGLTTGLESDRLNTWENNQNNRINFLLGNSADARSADMYNTDAITGLLGAMNDIVPNTNAWPGLGQAIGNWQQTQAIKDSQPSGWDQFLSGAGQGAGYGFGTLLAS